MACASATAELTVSRPHGGNWLALQQLELHPEQLDYVRSATTLLADCYYGSRRQQLLVFEQAGQVVGAAAWQADAERCWLEDFRIDARLQGKGYGRRALQALIEHLQHREGFSRFALCYHPQNLAAARLYRSFGFSESGEQRRGTLVATLDR